MYRSQESWSRDEYCSEKSSLKSFKQHWWRLGLHPHVLGWLLQVHRIKMRRQQHQLHPIPDQICTAYNMHLLTYLHGGEGTIQKPVAFVAHILSDECVLWFLNSFHVLRQWTGPSVSKTHYTEVLFICAPHLGLDRYLLCSPKGIWFMTGLFLHSRIQGNLNFGQGRGNLSPSMFFLANFAFYPTIAVSWMTFSEMQALWVTWLLIVQDVFLYELGVWRK